MTQFDPLLSGPMGDEDRANFTSDLTSPSVLPQAPSLTALCDEFSGPSGCPMCWAERFTARDLHECAICRISQPDHIEQAAGALLGPPRPEYAIPVCSGHSNYQSVALRVPTSRLGRLTNGESLIQATAFVTLGGWAEAFDAQFSAGWAA
ncbi:MAG: hypothetical protein WD557_01375 [Dehalococcoidia bacterium]